MLSLFWDSAAAYLSDRILPVLLGTALILAGRWLLILRGHIRRGQPLHEIGFGAFVLYAAVVLSLVFLPLSQPFGSFQFSSALFGLLTGSYTTGRWGFAMFLGNAVMFLPLGLMLPLLWETFRWAKSCAVCAGTILLVELLQPLSGRSFDVDDLILNAAGAFLGIGLCALLCRFVPPVRRVFSSQKHPIL